MAEPSHEPLPPIPASPSTKGSVIYASLHLAWRAIKIVFAFTLLLIAVILGLVPGIPGWPLAIFALILLAAEFVWARRLLERFRRQSERMRDVVRRARRKPRGSNGTPPAPPTA